MEGGTLASALGSMAWAARATCFSPCGSQSVYRLLPSDSGETTSERCRHPRAQPRMSKGDFSACAGLRIVRAVSFLHGKKMVHRDIKSSRLTVAGERAV